MARAKKQPVKRPTRSPSERPAPRGAATRKAVTDRKPAAKTAAPRKRATTKPAAGKPAAGKPAAGKRAVAKPAARKPPTADRPKVPRAPKRATSEKQAPARRTATKRARAPRLSQRRSGSVVELVESRQPIEELRSYLAGIEGTATIQEGQVALGAAQLMLLPYAREHRGGAQVTELLELVLARWDAFPDTDGFHATELLRNAFAAVGGDRAWIERLLALVPAEPTPELRLEIAAAHAAAGDRPAMLEAVRAALAAGVSEEQLRRHPSFAPLADDPELDELFVEDLIPGAADALEPPVAALVEHYVPPVRAALDTLITTLRELGQQARLHEPASLDLVLAAERARGVELPNDYRALLTVSDGFAVWEHEFASTKDLRGDTPLARAAREFVDARLTGTVGAEGCIALARCAQPDEWLLYDARGTLRGGEPGYLLVLATGPVLLDDLTQVLAYVAQTAAYELGTN